MDAPVTDEVIERLAKQFQLFAEKEIYSSPLYDQLCRGIAQDNEVLAIAAQTAPGQPVPNLLLGAVHYLLLSGIKHPLAAFYASLTDAPDLSQNVYPLFRAFCLEHTESIIGLLKTRRVQTNEVRRCATWLPAFNRVIQQEPNQPLALVEIGTSAGLNLLWDRYGYDYGEGRRYGIKDSPLQLTSTFRGAKIPALPEVMPEVTFRVGLDLNPIDIHDADAILWLRALIWPGHHERLERLENALTLARQNPPRLLAGDALELLLEVIESAPMDSTLCIFHSFTLNQFSPEAREQLSTLLLQASAERKIYRISFEQLHGKENPRLNLITYQNGARTHEELAQCEAHGSWIE